MSESSPTQAYDRVLWLDELDISLSDTGYGSPQLNKTVDGNPLVLGGKTFSRGIGNHAPSSIGIVLPNKEGRLIATIGTCQEPSATGTLEFFIYGDSRLLYQSGPMKSSDPPKVVDLNIQNVNLLRLNTDPSGVYYGDHSAWAEARIEYSGEKPRIVKLGSFLDEDGQPFDSTDETVAEWVSLFGQIKRGIPAERAEQTFQKESLILPTDRDPLDIVIRRVEPLIAHMKSMDNAPDLTAQTQTMAEIKAQASATPVTDKGARKQLFSQAVALRRNIMLRNPLLNFSDVLFIKRNLTNGAEMRGNHMIDQFFGANQLPGGGLFVLKNAFSDQPQAVNCLEGVEVSAGRLKGQQLTTDWSFLSPELSYDGTEVLFAACDTRSPRSNFTWTEDNCFHIFKGKFNPETGKVSDLVQLTDGAYNDFDPCYLPSGRIAFISERRGGYGRCHPRIVPTYTLYSMNPDGSDITMLSAHETNEWQPDVDHNGMIVYTRWDYVDRGAMQAHHPWITTPDGRDPRALLGNYDRQFRDRPSNQMNVHPIPGSNRLIATACAHHGQDCGSIVILDPQTRDDNFNSTFKRVTPEQPFPETESVSPDVDSFNYGPAWPLSDYFYLTAYDAFSKVRLADKNNYGIYLLDAFGNRELLYRGFKISCREAIPVRARTRQPIIPHQTLVGLPLAEGETFTPIDKTTLPKNANIGLVNVYDSQHPFPEGTKIERLRIVQVLPKTTPLESQPWIGYGHQKGARRILGTVPVESDGSAYFQVPVNVPVYFQALDGNGVAVQTMRSDTYVHEGEELVCQGCHENRHSASTTRPVGVPMAMRRAPSGILPDPEGTNPISFALLIQPILDQKCVQCHEESTDPKAIDLSRGKTDKHFFNSFENLKPFCFFYDNYYWLEPQTIPGQFGANRSPLYKILKSDHYGLKLTDEQMYRFVLWMDNNCDFYGTYEDCELQRQGKPVPIRLE